MTNGTPRTLFLLCVIIVASDVFLSTIRLSDKLQGNQTYIQRYFPTAFLRYGSPRGDENDSVSSWSNKEGLNHDKLSPNSLNDNDDYNDDDGKKHSAWSGALRQPCDSIANIEAEKKAIHSAKNLTVTEVISSTGVIFQGLKVRSFKGNRTVQTQVQNQEEFTKPKLVSGYNCSYWGVVTTIFEPTVAIKRVAEMPSWCLVIVADTKTPTNYISLLNALDTDNDNHTDIGSSESNSHVVFFSVEMQKEWESVQGPLGSFVSSIPWKHFSRKNLGYLFAIFHGAEIMFDFDDDNYVKIDEESQRLMDILPTKDEITGDMLLQNVSIVSIGTSVFNHHPIMGPSINETSWARGFPLDRIMDQHTHGKVLFQKDVPLGSHKEQVGVIQYLADGNPDIDALHRLAKPLPMNFDFGENSHPVMVPMHAYAPYNAQATIHTRDALWATFLPTTVPGRVSDIWRSYFAQCIFQDAGLRLVFAPPKIIQARNDHSYLGDFEAEHDLYAKSGKLLEFLKDWDDPSANSIPERMEKLWIDLYEHDYIELEDVHAVQFWLGALKQIGYNFPPLKRRYRNVAVMGQFNHVDSPSQIDNVIFWAQKQREYFHTVIAAGPFSNEQVSELAGHSIGTIVSTLSGRKNGHYDPYENLMVALQQYKNSSIIEAVLYAHDDLLLNITDLSLGQYPFPTDSMIGNTKVMERDEFSYGDPRKAVVSNNDQVRHFANTTCYRMYPNGTVGSFDNSLRFGSFAELYRNLPLVQWGMYMVPYCSGGQMKLTQDPEASKYRETDGSMLFPSYTQSDFLFVPTKYADSFAEAAMFHTKHNVFLECALPKIVDMVRQEAKEEVNVRLVKLCTSFKAMRRRPLDMISWCANHDGLRQSFGVLHPIKLNLVGYKEMDRISDQIQNEIQS